MGIAFFGSIFKLKRNQHKISGYEKLILLPRKSYGEGVGHDPIKYYFWPFLGRLYRHRVECALSFCKNGDHVIEIGYGSGVSFLNLEKKFKNISGVDLCSDPSAIQSLYQPQGLELSLFKGSILNLSMFADGTADTVLVISLLEHLRADELELAMKEIHRVLKPGGQLVYGVPVDRPMMTFAFWLMGIRIKEIHFSSHQDVSEVARKVFHTGEIIDLNSLIPLTGSVYQVGHFNKRKT